MSKPETRQDREARNIEMVETNNLCRSLKRIAEAPEYGRNWKRALYHALLMSQVACYSELEKIRQAIGLP